MESLPPIIYISMFISDQLLLLWDISHIDYPNGGKRNESRSTVVHYLSNCIFIPFFVPTNKVFKISATKSAVFSKSKFLNISSKPQDFERDTWYQTFPNEQNLPPISEYRLPFRLIFPSWCKSNNDPWKLISNYFYSIR